MSFILTEIKNPRDNNFNLLHFLAASLVLFGHSYAFLIQQAYVASYPDITRLTLFFFSFVTTLFLSILSWHFIEKPALSLKTGL